MQKDEITYWNRQENREEVEKVYGEALIQWLYTRPQGQKLTDSLLSKAWLSRIYGAYQSSWLSQFKIHPFIKDFKIDMKEYEEANYSSFNEFFIRKFRPGARKIEFTPNRMPAFAEGRYLAFESVSVNQSFPVKGEQLSPEKLLGSQEMAKDFEKGPLFIARLCPVDYHRFHFPDDGIWSEHFRQGGGYHSVNPLALRYRGDIFNINERQISIFETRNFGKLAYIEVGALCVGKIVQSHRPLSDFQRGQEKGYFLFGGSTVILLGQAGRWKPDADLLERTQKKQECLVRLGEAIASS